MEDIDRFFLNWARKNGLDAEEYVGFMGWPSKRNPEPYFEEIQHILARDLLGEDGIGIMDLP
jgi:hypothetical protein